MKLFTQSPRESLRLYFAFLLLIALSFYSFGLRPALAQLRLANAEYRNLQREVTAGRKQTRELVDYARRVGRLKDEVAGLEERLRPGNQLILLFRDAESAAALAGVELQTVTPGPAVTEEDVVSQTVGLVVSGKLDRLLRFIGRIEQLPYPVEVTKLDLKVSGAELVADLVLELHALKEGEGK